MPSPFTQQSMNDLKDQIRVYAHLAICDCDADTERHEIMDNVSTQTDTLWEVLVSNQPTHRYDMRQLLETAPIVTQIIEVGRDWAFLSFDELSKIGDHENPCALLANIAYYSLRTCMIQALQDMGIDFNRDYPMGPGSLYAACE